MRTVYVLMYWSDEGCMTNVPTGERTPPKLKPYAVFEDAITAERMKRDGDEIVTVPFFRTDQLVITDKALEGVDLEKLSPGDTPWKITYQSIPCKDSTMAPPDYNAYPKVTCSKTVDEHKWTNRVD